MPSSLMRSATFTAAVAGCTFWQAGCSISNRPEACEGDAPPPVVANQRVEGAQALETGRSIAVLPTGETLVLFSSSVAGLEKEVAQEVRAVRLKATGEPAEGCVSRDDREQILFPVALANPARQVARADQVVPPPGAMGIAYTGLGLVRRWEENTPTQLIAIPLFPQGCFVGLKDSIQVSAPSANRVVRGTTNPAILAFPPQGDLQTYAIFWNEVSPLLSYRAMARLLRVRAGIIEAAPTAKDASGAPIDLNLPGGIAMTGLDAVLTGPDELRLVWGSTKTSRDYSMFSQRFDLALRPKEDPQIFFTGLSMGGKPADLITTAFDGQHVLVVWFQGLPDGSSRAFARSYLPDGRPAGVVVQLGDARAANDNGASLVALPAGGFAAVWREQNSAGTTGEGSISLRLLALDTYGKKAFTKRACGRRDFAVVAGDVGPATLAAAPNGELKVAYTTVASDGTLSGSDVKLVSLGADALFTRGTALRPPTLDVTGAGAAPPFIQPHTSCQDPLAGKPGSSCTCNDACDPGGVCLPEEIRGAPGGQCRDECVPGEAGGCPAGWRCDPSSDNPREGRCDRTCARDSDCAAGRVCLVFVGACLPICSKADDCRTGVCDPYTGLCGSLNSNPGGRGLLAGCNQDQDCKSLFCTEADDQLFPKRCQVSCRSDVPGSCPESGVCYPQSGTYGSCLPPCTNNACTDPTLQCTQLPDFNISVCLPR